jgi:hypothetical protein
MSKRVRIEAAARQELRAAARWYEEQLSDKSSSPLSTKP